MRIFLLLLISFVINLSAQSHLSSEYNLIKASPISSTAKIGTESWFAGGSGVTDVGSLSSAFNNPAALQLQSLSVLAECTYRKETNWIFDYRYDGVFHPSFVSIGLPVSDMNISVSYIHQYSQDLESSEIPITTVDHPDGTGEFIKAVTNIDMHSIVGTAQYNISDLFSIGGSFGMNYFHSNEKILNSSAVGESFGMLAIIGIHKVLDEELSLGALFRYSSPMNTIHVKTNARPLTILDQTGNNSRLVGTIFTPKYVARLPWTFESGLKWKVSSTVDLSLSYDFQNWKFVSSTYENISSVHFGISMNLLDNVTFRAGLFTQDDPEITEVSQKFLTGGITFALNAVTISLGILDSRLFKGSDLNSFIGATSKQFHQTIVLTSISYML